MHYTFAPKAFTLSHVYRNKRWNTRHTPYATVMSTERTRASVHVSMRHGTHSDRVRSVYRLLQASHGFPTAPLTVTFSLRTFLRVCVSGKQTGFAFYPARRYFLSLLRHLGRYEFKTCARSNCAYTPTI